jgi:hypothetical protein
MYSTLPFQCTTSIENLVTQFCEGLQGGELEGGGGATTVASRVDHQKLSDGSTLSKKKIVHEVHLW